MVLWHSGAVVQLYSGTVVRWHSGAVAQWFTGAVVRWCSGTVAQWSRLDAESRDLNPVLRCQTLDKFVGSVHSALWISSMDQLYGSALWISSMDQLCESAA